MSSYESRYSAQVSLAAAGSRRRWLPGSMSQMGKRLMRQSKLQEHTCSCNLHLLHFVSPLKPSANPQDFPSSLSLNFVIEYFRFCECTLHRSSPFVTLLRCIPAHRLNAYTLLSEEVGDDRPPGPTTRQLPPHSPTWARSFW